MKRKNTDISTENARRKLKVRKEPYFTNLGDGVSLGFYRMKDGGSWIVRRRVDGKYSFETIGDEASMTYADAVTRASDQSSPVASGTQKWKVADAVGEYKKTASADAVSKLDGCPLLDKKLDALSVKDVEDWRDSFVNFQEKDREKLRKMKATANRKLSSLKAALNTAVRKEMTENIKFRIVGPFPKTDVPKKRFLTEDEAFAFLSNLNSPQIRDLCRAALLTGARYGELAAIKAKDFDPVQKTVKLSGAKTCDPRTVALNEDGVVLFTAKTKNAKPNDLVFTNTSDDPWKKSQQSYAVRKAYQRAGIEPLSFHDLRTTYGSWLAKAGVPLLNISKAMGHKDTRITSKHYAHLVETDQHDIVRAALPKLKKTA